MRNPTDANARGYMLRSYVYRLPGHPAGMTAELYGFWNIRGPNGPRQFLAPPVRVGLAPRTRVSVGPAPSGGAWLGDH